MKYCCLDIGNVLCKVNLDKFINDLSRSLSISKSDAINFVRRFQCAHDLGHTNIKDELEKSFNIKSTTINKILKLWNDCITPDYIVIDTFNNLIDSSDLQIALLSNIGIEHAALMENKLNRNGFFNKVIKHFSCEVGARKPSTIFYQSFLLNNPDYDGCLYVDDLHENLKAGTTAGFQAFKLDLHENNAIEKINQIVKILNG